MEVIAAARRFRNFDSSFLIFTLSLLEPLVQRPGASDQTGDFAL